MKNNRKYKRINFQLHSELALELEKLSVRAGIPKSKLLKLWIDQANSMQTFTSHINTKNSLTSFNFRVTEYEYLQIQKSAREKFISKSAFLRLLVTSNLSKLSFKLQNDIDEINKLRFSGLFKDYVDAIEPSVESLDKRNTFEFLNTLLKLGDTKKYQSYSELLPYSKDINDNNAHRNFLEAFKHFTIGELDKSLFYITQSLEQAKKVKDNTLISDCYYRLFDIHNVWEDVDKSIEYLNYALDYANPFVNTEQLAYLYVVKTQHAISKEDPSLIRPSLKHAIYYTEKSKNIFLKAKLYQTFSKYFQLMLDDYEKSKKYSILALDLNKKVGCEWRQFFDYRRLGNLELTNGNVDCAHQYFQKAEDIEIGYRANRDLCYGYIYRLYVESINNFDKSISIIESNTYFKEKNLRPTVIELLKNSAKFLNGKDFETIEEGRIGLKKIACSASKASYQKSAEKILENRSPGIRYVY